jgi:hypothetical protein
MICLRLLSPVAALALATACLNISEAEHAEWMDRDGDGVDGTADCNDADGAVTEEATYYRDADGDGVGDAAFPLFSCGAPEGYVAEAGDECDEVADLLEPVLYFADSDGDGFGNPGSTQLACEPSGSFVADDQDCNDGNPDISPASSELCNGVDDDCDDAVDEDDAQDVQTWFADGDGDGYADPKGATVQACAPPPGYAGDTTDCDDADPDINPGETEVCGDGVDNDCDGGGCPYAGEWTADDRTWTYSPVLGGGSLGISLQAGDRDGDGDVDLAIGSDRYATTGGAVYLVDAPLDRDINLLTEAEIRGATGDYLGASVEFMPDANGDGVGDIALGARMHSGRGPLDEAAVTGRVYLLSSDTAGGNASSQAWAVLEGAMGDAIGENVAWIGDNDVDGLADIAIGSEWMLPGGAVDPTGGVYVLHKAVSGTVSLPATADAIVYGVDELDRAGSDVTGADIDGDGYRELLIGAAYATANGSTRAGVVYGYTTPLSGIVAADDASIAWRGQTAGSFVGETIESAGDVNADGYEDLLIGANDDDNDVPPIVYLVYGEVFPDGAKNLSDDALRIDGSGTGSGLGYRMAHVDLDGDGADDPVLGDNDDNYVHVFYGPLSGDYDIEDADILIVGGEGASIGWGLTGADADEDGLEDLLIGAPGANGFDGEIRVYRGLDL